MFGTILNSTIRSEIPARIGVAPDEAAGLIRAPAEIAALPDDAPGEQVALSVYEVPLKHGVRYAPHPAFAKDAQGRYRADKLVGHWVVHLAAHLAPHKRPRRICFVPAIPHSAAGKPDRLALARYAFQFAWTASPWVPLGGAVAQSLILSDWQGMGSKADFQRRQVAEPLLVSMGMAEQRGLVAAQ